MLRLFDSSNPLSVFFLLCYTALFRLGIFFGLATTETSLDFSLISSLTEAVVNLIPFSKKWVWFLTSTIFIFINALLINHILKKHKVFPKSTNLPGVLFVLFCSIIPEFIAITPAFFTIPFCVFLIDKLFAAHKEKQAFSLTFDAGFLISIAALIFKPFIALIFVAIIALVILRPFIWREWIILFIGFITPLFLFGTGYFLFGDFWEFWNWLVKFSSQPKVFPFSFTTYFWAISSGLLSIFAFLKMSMMYNSSLIHFRRFVGVIIILLLVLLIIEVAFPGFQISNLVMFAFPVSIIFTSIFSEAKREIRNELIHAFLFLSAMGFQLYEVVKQ